MARGWRRRRDARTDRQETLSESRSLEEALADLRAKYDIHPTPELARMIRQLQAEIAERKQLQQEPRHDGGV